MSTPTSPQGSPLEQAAKNNSLAAKVTFIALAHVAVLAGGLVFYGCSPESKSGNNAGAATPGAGSAAAPTAPTYTPPSEPVSPAPLTDTNGIVAPVGGGTGPVAGGPTPGGATGASTTTNPVPALPISGPAVSVPPTGSPGTEPLTGATLAGGNAPAGGTTEYKVQKGDIGTSIAKKHNVSLAQLKAANPSVNWSKLKIDQPIQIPAPSAAAETKPAAGTGVGAPHGAATEAPATTTSTVIHTVKPHETLVGISKKYGVSWKKIRAANGLKSDNIKVGDKLKIPAKAGGNATPAGGGAAASPAPAPAATEPSAQPLPTGGALPGRQP